MLGDIFHFIPDDGGATGAPPSPAPAPATTAAPAEPAEPAYYSQLSPELRDKIKARPDWKEFREKVPRLNHLAEAYLDSKDKLGRAVIIPDPKTATPEDVAAFKKGMGIPDKPEEYAFDAEKYKGVPDMDKLTDAARALSLTAGLTKGQASKVFDFVAGLVKTGTDSQATQKAETEKTFPARLLEAVGKDQKKAEEVTNRLIAFMTKEIGDAALVQEFRDNGLMFNPAFATKIAALSAKLDDAPYIDGGGAGASKSKGQFGNSYSPEFNKTFGGDK